MSRLLSLFSIGLLFLSACAQREAPFDSIRNLAIKELSSVQARSIAERREFCGWIYEREGEVRASEIVRGNFDRCRMPDPPRGSHVVASFHTHGNHSPLYFSEIPSDLDVKGELRMGTLGFVATPGGRVWVIDPNRREIYEICGEGCILQDPNYRASDYGPIPKSMTPEMIYSFYQ